MKAHVVVFCECGRLMRDENNGLVTCLNPLCLEYGKDYVATVTITEKRPARV